jgi:hypothetical protein
MRFEAGWENEENRFRRHAVCLGIGGLRKRI